MAQPPHLPPRGRMVLVVFVACLVVTIVTSALHASDRWASGINTVIVVACVVWVLVEEHRRRPTR